MKAVVYETAEAVRHISKGHARGKVVINVVQSPISIF